MPSPRDGESLTPQSRRAQREGFGSSQSGYEEGDTSMGEQELKASITTFRRRRVFFVKTGARSVVFEKGNALGPRPGNTIFNGTRWD